MIDGRNITARILLASVATVALAAFDNKAGWKMEGDKIAVDGSGNPIWIDGAGAEKSIGGDTITRLGGEAAANRKRYETAEEKLKSFEGLDPAAARDAFDKLSKIDQKKLIDAGEVDKVREEVAKSYTGQLDEAKKAAGDWEGKFNNMLKNSTLKESKFISDAIAVPADMFLAQFGQNFKVEDGKIVPYGPDGNKVYSMKRAGEVADVDEALEIIVGAYPHKDRILKAPDQRGSGNGGGGGGRGGGRTVTRSQFAALSPAQQAEHAALQSKGELTITD